MNEGKKGSTQELKDMLSEGIYDEGMKEGRKEGINEKCGNEE